MSSSVPLSSSQYRVCRLVRSPMAIAAVVLLYMTTMFAFRESDQPSGFMALRGAQAQQGSSASASDGEETLERDVDEQWDPLPDQNYNYAERGPVKGGVEVYPLQPARRARTAKTPLVPEVAEIEGTLTAWKMPEEYDRGGGEAIKGVYVVFHGCNHGPLDWFDLPEERAIVSSLADAGYAVVAPASQDRVSGCWKHNAAGGDIDSVRAVLWRWYRDWSISPTTPLFLFGASSGGSMATLLASKGGFQLCDKVTTYVQVSGVMSQVSWGVAPAAYGKNCPPIGFMPMPKGEVDSKEDDVAKNVPPVFGNSRKIPAQISSIAHYVRKSGGRPRMLLLPLGQLSLYKAFFSDRVYEISPSQSTRLYNALLATRTVTCNPKKLVGGEPECFLNKDPRESKLALETLTATYLATLGGSDSESETSRAGDGSASGRPANGDANAAGNGNGNGNGTAVSRAAPEVTGGSQLRNRREQEQAASGLASGPLPILQPASTTTAALPEMIGSIDDFRDVPRSGGGAGGGGGGGAARVSIADKQEETRMMTEHHATEVFRELLNVAWGAHEISADFVGLWEEWLWESCGDNCRPWPSR